MREKECSVFLSPKNQIAVLRDSLPPKQQQLLDEVKNKTKEVIKENKGLKRQLEEERHGYDDIERKLKIALDLLETIVAKL